MHEKYTDGLAGMSQINEEKYSLIEISSLRF